MCARLAATSQIVTVADALSKRLPAGAMNVVLDTGSPKGVAAAANASSGADLAVVVVGDTSGSCGESDDRMELDLLGNQLDLLEAVLATGTPTLTVLIHGRPGECRHTHALTTGTYRRNDDPTALCSIHHSGHAQFQRCIVLCRIVTCAILVLYSALICHHVFLCAFVWVDARSDFRWQPECKVGWRLQRPIEHGRRWARSAIDLEAGRGWG
jgi:hypothetical protein